MMTAEPRDKCNKLFAFVDEGSRIRDDDYALNQSTRVVKLEKKGSYYKGAAPPVLVSLFSSNTI